MDTGRACLTGDEFLARNLGFFLPKGERRRHVVEPLLYCEYNRPHYVHGNPQINDRRLTQKQERLILLWHGLPFRQNLGKNMLSFGGFWEVPTMIAGERNSRSY